MEKWQTRWDSCSVDCQNGLKPRNNKQKLWDEFPSAVFPVRWSGHKCLNSRMSFFAFVNEIFTENPAKQCFHASSGRHAFNLGLLMVSCSSPKQRDGSLRLFDRCPFGKQLHLMFYFGFMCHIEKTDRLT